MKALERLNTAIAQLEEKISLKNKDLKNSSILRVEFENLQKEHNNLKETSQEVINELNNAIHVIEEYFNKQNANNKNT